MLVSHRLPRVPQPAAPSAAASMPVTPRPQENYLNHPTFGLLYGLCTLTEAEGLFTTLYAQRLFFRVSLNPPLGEEMTFEPISRNEARHIVEEQVRVLRRQGLKDELNALQLIYQRTFA